MTDSNWHWFDPRASTNCGRDGNTNPISIFSLRVAAPTRPQFSRTATRRESGGGRYQPAVTGPSAITQRQTRADNLELHLLPIEEVPTLGLDFDLMVSTGVLTSLDRSAHRHESARRLSTAGWRYRFDARLKVRPSRNRTAAIVVSGYGAGAARPHRPESRKRRSRCYRRITPSERFQRGGGGIAVRWRPWWRRFCTVLS